MRLMIGAALLLLPTASAFAGGVGVLATGGAHSERFYYYSDTSPEGEPYRNIDNYDQYQISPILGQGGGGLELILGDRDDKIMGSMRFFYSGELPPPPLENIQDDVDEDALVYSVRDQVRHLGFGMVGLSWGLVGNPGGFQLTAVGHVGTAFLTFDHSEFFAFQIGPGFTWRMSRQTQLFGDVQYQGRLEKGRYGHAGYGTVGLRYLFD